MAVVRCAAEEACQFHASVWDITEPGCSICHRFRYLREGWTYFVLGVTYFADLIRSVRAHCVELSQFSYMCGANSTHLQDIGSVSPFHTLFGEYGRIFRSILFQLWSLENHRFAIYWYGKDIKKLPLTLLHPVTSPCSCYQYWFLCFIFYRIVKKKRDMWARENGLATNSSVPVNLCALLPYIQSRNVVSFLFSKP